MNLKALSITDAASRTGIPAESIRKLLVRGELAGNKVGSKWYVSEEALHAWLHRTTPQPPAPETSAFADVEDRFS